MLAIESQRLALLQPGAKGFKAADISAQLERARDADVGADTRNWELVPMLVGNKAMSEVLSLGAGGSGWVKRWRVVLGAVEMIAAGGEVKELAIDEVGDEEVCLLPLS